MSHWVRLGKQPPGSLEPTRLELQHAYHLVAIGIGRALLPHRDDAGHTALAWRSDTAQWVTETLPGSDGLRVGLRPADMTLTCGRDGEKHLAESVLGQTRVAGLTWLRGALRQLGGRADEVALEFDYPMPPHPLLEGAAFRGELRPGHMELSSWFGNAARLTASIAAGYGEATPILTWPQHFDMATLLPAGRGTDATVQTLGVGLSPGDRHFAEPYFYVAPWPRPDTPEVPRLPVGEWLTEEFFGAVLTATRLFEAAGEDEQEATATLFCEAAIAAGRRLFES